MVERKEITSIFGLSVRLRRARSTQEAARHGWSNDAGQCILICRIDDNSVIASVSSIDLFDVEGNHFAEND